METPPTETDETPAEEPAPAAPSVEIVERTAPATPGAAGEQIDAALAAVVALPAIPGRDEFLSLAMQARILSMSGAAPAAIRDNPQVAFHVAMIGRDLGISPTSAMELVDLIETKRNSGEYRPSLSPQLMMGQVKRLGIGKVAFIERSAFRALAVLLEPDGALDRKCVAEGNHVEGCACRGIIGESEFTWEDAQMAGLAGPKCSPGNHVEETHTGNGRSWKSCGCNNGYKTYPKRMLAWRAGGFVIDDFAPEATLGLYAPEALGSLVDDDGRPIDPATVALPEGYEPEVDRRFEEELADEDTRNGLRARIEEIPPEIREAMGVEWKERQIWPLSKLPARQGTIASALVERFEGIRDAWMAEHPGERHPSWPPESGETGPGEAESGAGGSEGPTDAPIAPTPPEAPIPLAEIPDEIKDEAAHEVKAMTIGAVRAELIRRRMDALGDSDTIKFRLAAAICVDRELLRRSLAGASSPEVVEGDAPALGSEPAYAPIGSLCATCGETATGTLGEATYCTDHLPF